MRLLLVGGHSRSVGKTSLVADVIRVFRGAAWTAVKITQYGHDVCAVNGKQCDCAPRDACAVIEEEFRPTSGRDTSRFLAAGAARVFWLRARQGSLAQAMPLLFRELERADNVVIESNSLLEFVEPTLYLVCLDPARRDFKSSALRFLGRADGFVLRSALHPHAWPDVPLSQLERHPHFLQPLGTPLPARLLALIASRFLASESLMRTTVA